MCLNHPEITPHQSVEILSSTKLVPGAKNFGDRCASAPKYENVHTQHTHRAGPW